MHDSLAGGSVIRKLWIGEADTYRAHLLRLDQDSRHGRFGCAVADEFINNYVATTFGLNAAMHGFFIDGVLRELVADGHGFTAAVLDVQSRLFKPV